MATKRDLITEAARRLGDTTTPFIENILNGVFDQVMNELALNQCIRQLRQENTFNFVDGQRGYDTATITGLTSPPIEVYRLVVPAWGPSGILARRDEDEYVRRQALSVDGDGNDVPGRPTVWTLIPNETTLRVDPVPRAEDVDDEVVITFVAPPTVLGLDDDVTEVRAEGFPVIVAGIIKYGSVFQDETVVDRRIAAQEYEIGMIRLKGHARGEQNRDKRTQFRDF